MDRRTFIQITRNASIAIGGASLFGGRFLSPRPEDALARQGRPGDMLSLERSFITPPASTRPGVFWQWMGGLLSKEGITKDLEAMSAQGVGKVLVMQMPDQAPYPQRWEFRDYPGKVEVLSDEWFDIVNHAIGEADRLGMTFSMFICPGWSHAGGPWVTPRRSLKTLVSKKVEVEGPMLYNKPLPRAPRSVGIGGGNEVPSWVSSDSSQERHERPEFYRDVAVVAVPSSDNNEPIPESSTVVLTDRMDDDGVLKWNVPEGSWTIMRLGIASENGVNHPAPAEATGLESSRMDPEAVRIVFDGMIARIIREARAEGFRSFKAFETDSYEAGFQDFSLDFREEFKKRRGYDCVPWLPAWLDNDLVMGDKELTRRFRSDMTWTISELTAERFHGKLRSLAEEYDVEWMIEPYFRLPIDWRSSGAKSELPGSEFWVEKPYGLIAAAPDIAALYGRPVVWAESFTAESYNSAWRNDPWLLKPWGDGAYCRGINQFYMHGFVHNPFGDYLQPGLTMGYWGTQFNRHVTWWPYSASWHRYLARCQFMLRQGRPVNDVLAYPPKIQRVPTDVVDAGPFRQVVLNDEALLERIWVRDDGRIEVKGGGDFAAITLTPGMALRPEALRRIRDLVRDGATLIGERPPRVSSSLEGYPECDREISALVDELWGSKGSGKGVFNERPFGKGRVMATTKLVDALNLLTGGPDVKFYGESGNGPINLKDSTEVQFEPGQTLTQPSVQVNATSDESLSALDFAHRRDGDTDIFLVCNTGDETVKTVADFRADGRVPELWDPVTGQAREVLGWRQQEGRTKVAMCFAPRQSFFVVFREATDKKSSGTLTVKAPQPQTVKEFSGPWDVSFDPEWGGPAEVVFDNLVDWTKRSEEGIKYYSGSAAYQKQFNLSKIPSAGASSKLYIDVGDVHDLARVTLNGRELGVVWCAPWRAAVPPELLRKEGNELKIEVVNTWVNRLIGDEQEPEDSELIEWNPDTRRKGSYDLNVGSRGLKDLPDWVVNEEPRPSSGRYTFTTWRFYDKNAPLRPAGLLGPVKIVSVS